MKKLFALLVVLGMVCTVEAADMTKFGMRAYSSASQIQCAVWGQGDRLKIDGYGKQAIQGFSPDTTYSRTYALGTKGLGNYSTVYPGNIKLTALKFTCRVNGTSTAALVKVFMNDVETHFLTLSSGDFTVGR